MERTKIITEKQFYDLIFEAQCGDRNIDFDDLPDAKTDEKHESEAK